MDGKLKYGLVHYHEIQIQLSLNKCLGLLSVHEGCGPEILSACGPCKQLHFFFKSPRFLSSQVNRMLHGIHPTSWLFCLFYKLHAFTISHNEYQILCLNHQTYFSLATLSSLLHRFYYKMFYFILLVCLYKHRIKKNSNKDLLRSI